MKKTGFTQVIMTVVFSTCGLKGRQEGRKDDTVAERGREGSCDARGDGRENNERGGGSAVGGQGEADLQKVKVLPLQDGTVEKGRMKSDCHFHLGVNCHFDWGTTASPSMFPSDFIPSSCKTVGKMSTDRIGRWGRGTLVTIGTFICSQPREPWLDLCSGTS